jgi:hypothetical protein
MPLMLSNFVKKLVRSRFRKTPSNRRQIKRLRPGQPAHCVLVIGEDHKISARIHNLSLRGAGIISDHSFPSGKELLLLVVNHPHTYALTIEFTVARSTLLRSGRYVVGGRFRRELQLEELLPFLI